MIEGKHQKAWNQTWSNLQRWWWGEQNLCLLFSWWLTESAGETEVQAEDFCFVSFSRAPSRLPYVHSFVPQHFLGLVCRSSWRNRTLKPEPQMGSQGEESESKSFSLDISSGKVCYCAKPCSESGKLFQFCIFLFFFLLPVITAQMASSSGQGHAPKFSQMGPQGCSGPLQYNRTICMLFKQLQTHIPGTGKHTHRGENAGWISFCIVSASVISCKYCHQTCSAVKNR